MSNDGQNTTTRASPIPAFWHDLATGLALGLMILTAIDVGKGFHVVSSGIWLVVACVVFFLGLTNFVRRSLS